MVDLEVRLVEREGQVEVAKDLFKRALLARNDGWTPAELLVWYAAIFEWVKDCEESKELTWTTN